MTPRTTGRGLRVGHLPVALLVAAFGCAGSDALPASRPSPPAAIRRATRDTSPPALAGMDPAAGDTAVEPLPRIVASFNEPVTKGTLVIAQGAQADTEVGVAGPVNALTFTAALPLAYQAPVTFTISGVTDTAGNVMAPRRWSARTRTFSWPLAALIRTPIPTYDGSGASIHPSVLFFPGGWLGWQYVMAYTPYPYLLAARENPSIAVSHDGLVWVTPAGLHNPVILPDDGPVPEPGYPWHANGGADAVMSDPDLSYDVATDRLRLCSREVRARARGDELVLCQEATDYTHWSAPVEVLRGGGHEVISPTFVLDRRGGWTVWAVAGTCGDSTSVVRRLHSGDTAAVATDLRQPGYVIWHIQVRYFAVSYWALYNAYRPGARRNRCAEGDLFLARSADGDHWTTFTEPVLRHPATGDFSAGFYRSSLVYDPAGDALELFVSGFVPAGLTGLQSQQGTVRYRFGDLLATLTPSRWYSGRWSRRTP